MKIGDLVKVKGDSRSNYGLGFILRVKKEPTSAYSARIMEVFFNTGVTHTITESLLEAIS